MEADVYTVEAPYQKWRRTYTGSGIGVQVVANKYFGPYAKCMIYTNYINISMVLSVWECVLGVGECVLGVG